MEGTWPLSFCGWASISMFAIQGLFGIRGTLFAHLRDVIGEAVLAADKRGRLEDGRVGKCSAHRRIALCLCTCPCFELACMVYAPWHRS